MIMNESWVKWAPCRGSRASFSFELLLLALHSSLTDLVFWVLVLVFRVSPVRARPIIINKKTVYRSVDNHYRYIVAFLMDYLFFSDSRVLSGGMQRYPTPDVSGRCFDSFKEPNGASDFPQMLHWIKIWGTCRSKEAAAIRGGLAVRTSIHGRAHATPPLKPKLYRSQR